MIAVLAEKPSVAQELANYLGITQKKKGYWQGNGYEITWALGHLVGLAMPQDYGIKGFQRENLPITPNDFLLVPRQIKARNGYKTDTRIFEQLLIVKGIFKRCEKIIVATDAGREGELIFRYIYKYLNCNKPFERLWISSLTHKAIRQGFENLQKGNDFDKLYQSAKARSQADWLVGINATQALSIQAQNGVYSLGRVQTPTLAIICKRHLEHTAFIPQNYWQLQLRHQYKGIIFTTLSAASYTQKTDAVSSQHIVAKQPSARVTKLSQKEYYENPPLLYDLTGLQKEANIRYNLSSQETLAIAQRLYEKKLITYPRTGSNYIPQDMWKDSYRLICHLEKNEFLKEYAKGLRLKKLNKHIVNDAKVTDHHALLITENQPEALTKQESIIYGMIASRLLEAVSEVCIKEITYLECRVADQSFKTKGTVIISPGWRNIKGFSNTKESQQLPEMEQGQRLKITSVGLLDKQTRPRPLHTEASLLSAMEHAGKEIENEAERSAIKEIGLGTPATRAAVIETLFQRDYIQRQKKALLPTEKGLQVFKIVKDKRIADVAMTGQWEKALMEIEKGKIPVANFHKKIRVYALQITKELLALKVASPYPELPLCPKCKKEHLRCYEKVVKCPDTACGWMLFRTLCGKKLSTNAITTLLEKGKSPLLKGLKSKAKETFDAYLILNQDATTAFEFPNKYHKKK